MRNQCDEPKSSSNVTSAYVSTLNDIALEQLDPKSIVLHTIGPVILNFADIESPQFELLSHNSYITSE